MILHRALKEYFPRIARKGPRPFRVDGYQNCFAVDNCIYKPKRGKVDKVRVVPQEYADELVDIDHDRALLHQRRVELIREAWLRAEPWRAPKENR